jgi:hypothetical protein
MAMMMAAKMGMDMEIVMAYFVFFVQRAYN